MLTELPDTMNFDQFGRIVNEKIKQAAQGRGLDLQNTPREDLVDELESRDFLDEVMLNVIISYGYYDPEVETLLQENPQALANGVTHHLYYYL